MRVRRAPNPPDPKTLPLDGCDMLLCMHVEEALPLTDLAELCPCDLQEAMARVSRMVELGMLELLPDDEPVLPHYSLPDLLRSVAPANASQASSPPSAQVARGGSTAPTARSVRPAAPSFRPAPPSVRPVAPSVRPVAPSVRPAVSPPADEPAAHHEDDSPPTGVRLRFEVDPLAARRALLGAVVLERRPAPGALESAGSRRVRRRVPGSST